MWSPPAPKVKAGQVSEKHLFPRKSRHKWTYAQIGLYFVSKIQDFCTKMKAAVLFSISWGTGGCQDHVVLIKRWADSGEFVCLSTWPPPAPKVNAGQVTEKHLFPRKSRHKWTHARKGGTNCEGERPGSSKSGTIPDIFDPTSWRSSHCKGLLLNYAIEHEDHLN